MKRILLVVLAAGALLAQGDPSIGTWKLNTAKSKYSPGTAPQSVTQTVEAQGNGAKLSNEGTAADGSRIGWTTTTNRDGKDNPISGQGAPGGADIYASKRINPNTTETTFKKAGKVVQTTRSVVSKDGKVRTSTSKGKDANGKPTNNVTVWEKQ
ncbi:MAG: hypothetical protein ABSB35_01845 [Bryobacteraceae bacterium]|jgi:hypothetical protein